MKLSFMQFKRKPIQGASAAAVLIHILTGLIFLCTLIICAFSAEARAIWAAVSAIVLAQRPFLLIKWCRTIPPAVWILWDIFLLSSILGGEILDFYTRFSIWDLGVHFLSGFLFAVIGAVPVYRLQPSTGIIPAASAFSLSLSSSLLWEFTEFACDRLFGADMQRDTLMPIVSTRLLGSNAEITRIRIDSITVNGAPWPGYIDIGLVDTMTDLLAGAAGASVFFLLALLIPHSSGCRTVFEALVPEKR